MGREDRRVRLQKLLTSCFSDSFRDLWWGFVVPLWALIQDSFFKCVPFSNHTNSPGLGVSFSNSYLFTWNTHHYFHQSVWSCSP